MAASLARTTLAALALLAACAPSPAAAEWKFCAPEGGHCHCFGEMRFGHPGAQEHHDNDGEFFKQHPEAGLLVAYFQLNFKPFVVVWTSRST